LYCSQLVLDEAASGDQREAKKRLAHLRSIMALELTPPVRELARALLRRKAMPAKAQVDALPLAIAAVNGMDYLLTWNCRHLANAALKLLLERICTKAGYSCPIICTPEELLEDERWPMRF
jgi:hypothetical protein